MQVRVVNINKQVNSQVWKTQQKEIRIQVDKVQKQFNSPEWKKQMEDMQKNIQDEVNRNLKNVQSDSTRIAN